MCFNECSELIQLDSTLCEQDNFFQFVYGKISKDTKNRSIEKGESFIDVLPFNKTGTRVIPSFKEIDTKSLSTLHQEMVMAVDTICNDNNQIAQVYIACPKNKNFSKHIEVKIPDLEEYYKDQYRIKVIPYSLESILRDQKAS